MPVSSIESITPIMLEVARLAPKKVLDLGVGVGKYGALCREVLDGAYGRVRRFDWQSEIIGVEGFRKYSNPIWGAYNHVVESQFHQLPTSFYRDWDLVLMIDSLEHLEETEGAVLLRRLAEANKRVIVSVPVGVCPQEAVFGNELERHRTTFDRLTGFEQYNYKPLYSGVCRVLSISGVRV